MCVTILGGAQLPHRCFVFPQLTPCFCFFLPRILSAQRPSEDGPVPPPHHPTPPSTSYTNSSAHIYTQTRMQPLASQMESMWMSINRVEKGREWAAGGEEGGGAAAGATDQNHGQLPLKRRELFYCLTKTVSIHMHRPIHNTYTCAVRVQHNNSVITC